MGKLRFTLTAIIFWIVLILSCLLSENLFAFGADPLASFSTDQAFVITIGVIGLLFIYYFFEHKKNGLKFDKILLPSFCVAGLLLIVNVLRQTTRSFISYSGMWDFVISFSLRDRIMASLQIVIWLAVVYALVFVYNRFRLNKESYRWIAKIYLIGTLFMCLLDHFIEGNTILGILDGSYEGEGLQFLMGNANVWSLLVFSGFLSAVLLSFKRFKWYYYVAMVYLLVFNTLTTCATTSYISIFAIIAYTTFEIISKYKSNKLHRRRLLALYLGFMVAIFGLVTILIVTKVPPFYHVWNFLSRELFIKDYVSLTGRTDLWQRLWTLMSRNPLDLILGLGHQTGSFIFQEYMGHTVKSTHNAFFEIFLRYGFVGLLVYLGIIGLTIYSLVKHIKQKNYRFSFIYGLCFVSIIIHSLTESTTLFTPNVGGLYFSFVFVLPILNILQEKHFKALKEDLLTVNVSKETINSSVIYLPLFVIAGSVTFTILLKNIFNIGPYRTILVLLAVLLVSFITISLLRKNKENKPLDKIANNLLLIYKERISKEKDDE